MKSIFLSTAGWISFFWQRKKSPEKREKNPVEPKEIIAMHDFKRKTAQMPHIELSPSTVNLSEQLDEIGDLQCRVLEQLLKQGDYVDQKTNWACAEIVQLSHMQNQIIDVTNGHADKIDGIERRESAYKAEIGAYVKSTILLATAVWGVILWGINYFFGK